MWDGWVLFICCCCFLLSKHFEPLPSARKVLYKYSFDRSAISPGGTHWDYSEIRMMDSYHIGEMIITSAKVLPRKWTLLY